MGRLIDADAFKKKVCTYQQTGCGDCKHSLCCPEDAPTVDAIPVEWLKEKLTDHPELSYAITDGINNVLDLWEEKHKHDGEDCPLVDAIPRERIEQMVAEIEESIKACENLKNDKMALAIESRESYDTRILTYRHALAIIHKYTKEAKDV